MAERDPVSQATICALATGPAPSAVAVLRISGKNVRAVMKRGFGEALQPRIVSRRRFKDDAGDLVDDCLAVFMPGPRSYTGEDVLEISVHGGKAVIEHVLEALLSTRLCRLAEPGEFTRRAFEAGKLDLLEAEGVADAIDAETRAQKDQALRQLGGGVSEIYEAWRTQLLRALALLEAAIDFPDEEDAPDDVDGPVHVALTHLIGDIEAALAQDRIGERIREGFRIAIVGPPNAGKSSLLNHLAGRDAAIVTDIAGTTRDTIEVRNIIGGTVVWFVDTAGLRETDDIVEAEGVRRATAAAKDADLRLHMIDGAAPSPPGGPVAAQDIMLFNKADVSREAAPEGALPISVKTGAGLIELESRIADWIAGKVSGDEPVLITRARHRAGLAEGLDHLRRAAASLEAGLGAELVAEDARRANRALGALVGAVGVEDVLGAVFAEFCIGK